MTKPTLGVGLVGAGFLAETRARCWAAATVVEARIEAVCARTTESANAWAHKHGVARAFTELDELLALDEVQVVDLCVPNRLHRPMGERAAAAGKHVICTKPLTAYVGQDLAAEASDADVSGRDRDTMYAVAVADAQAMVDAASAHGVQLYYGENWVYAPSIRRAEALLAAAGQPLLEMRGWEAHNGSHSPYSKLWRHTGGGALLRLGSHPIGAMLHLKRAEGLRRDGAPIRPVAVTAEVSDLTRVRGFDADASHVATGWVDVESWGQCIVLFADGSRGVAHGSDVLLGGMESRLDLLAPNAHLKCRLSPHDLLSAYAPAQGVFGDEYIMEKTSTKAGWNSALPDEDWSSGQLGMIEAFAAAAVEGRAEAADGELGLDVTRVLYAAYRSAAAGRRIELEPGA